jgi:hypothetical protein
VEGTLAQHEPSVSEHGRTPAQDERSGEPAGQTPKTSRTAEQELAHDLGRSFEAWLASLLSLSSTVKVVLRRSIPTMVTPGTRSSVVRGATTARLIPVML